MFIKNIYRKLIDFSWTIGFLDNTMEEIVNGARPIVRPVLHNYKDRWLADPFILDVNDNYIFLLVEEFILSNKKAHISKLTIEKDSYKLVKSEPILILDTHLSYPAIIRRNKEIYVYPESGQSGKLILYKYDMQSNSLVEGRIIMNQDVGDATYTDLFGEDLIFCTMPPKYNENELHICRKTGDSLYHDSEVVRFNDYSARMAGDFFKIGEKIYRPSQDCNKSYGNGTVIQEVSLKNGKWHFDEVNRYTSPNGSYPAGIHTLNHYKGVVVVDLLKYNHPIIRRLLLSLRKKIGI